jgi:hypothetical protein
MPSPDRACNKRGKACIYFLLEWVSYDQSRCLLVDNQQEIKVVIQGLRSANSSRRHNYKVVVRETGGQSFAQFARKSDLSPQTFLPGDIEQTGVLDSSGYLEITFLVKRTQSLASTTQKIIVYCEFGHGFQGRWCTDRHKASIELTVM